MEPKLKKQLPLPGVFWAGRGKAGVEQRNDFYISWQWQVIPGTFIGQNV